jgi:hypothetical protein
MFVELFLSLVLVLLHFFGNDLRVVFFYLLFMSLLFSEFLLLQLLFLEFLLLLKLLQASALLFVLSDDLLVPFVELLFVGLALLWGHVLKGLCMGLLLLVSSKSLLE